jgi:hypothetical protein
MQALQAAETGSEEESIYERRRLITVGAPTPTRAGSG